MALLQLVPKETYDQHVQRLRQRDLGCLAPKMRGAVDLAVGQTRKLGHDVVVFETCRCQELQTLYWEHKASNASDVLFGWHVYGLAIDVVSEAHGWDLFPGGKLYEHNPWWWHDVKEVFQVHGLDSGADWSSIKDYPHWQWGRCKASPSARARELYASGGRAAVWQEVLAA